MNTPSIRSFQPIPLHDMRSLHLHFRFTDLALLPDTVFLDIPKIRKKREHTVSRGSEVTTEMSVTLLGLFVSLQQHNLISVACTCTWIQNHSLIRDEYIVHFCFVPKTSIDMYKAMFHDVEKAQASFEHLTQHYWNLAIYANNTGFDINCFRPSKRSGNSLLSVYDKSLGLQ